MDKKLVITVVVVSLIILVLGGILVASYQKKIDNSQKNIKPLPKNALIYYYGITCPHCRELNEWMKKNDIEKKIKLEKKEVYNNQLNAAELDQAAKTCGLNPMTIGVPFLYDNGQCYIGTDKIEAVFLKKLKK